MINKELNYIHVLIDKKTENSIGFNLIGVYDTKESTLIAIYHYLKESHKIEAENDSTDKEWSEYIGTINDFHIQTTILNAPTMSFNCPDLHISDSEYKNFMEKGPRNNSLKQLLGNDNKI